MDTSGVLFGLAKNGREIKFEKEVIEESGKGKVNPPRLQDVGQMGKRTFWDDLATVILQRKSATLRF
ncbi:unnamed protein product [Bursaphelenchus xylophilus]|uniref:(pine wood nematode) hypothetical protein n=1 Tax=Bursaphelenchus xylophilus TaxID=6326 RepID=A0A1I7SC92_BURXY|nr:unnamed protein product [Bursaphelenchus xylophilus]CAG9094530.1 unnamed protein product [Bursaphelenchus xylophilus]